MVGRPVRKIGFKGWTQGRPGMQDMDMIALKTWLSASTGSPQPKLDLTIISTVEELWQAVLSEPDTSGAAPAVPEQQRV